MAERLYIRSPNDLPHTPDDDTNVSKCGEWLAGAKEITEAQAQKFLGNARCPACFPSWTGRKGHGYG
jgi:hypothetical protein